MNATQRREARVRVSFSEHVASCADDACIACARHANTDTLVRLGRDVRLALETLEFVEQHQRVIPLEAWRDGGGI